MIKLQEKKTPLVLEKDSPLKLTRGLFKGPTFPGDRGEFTGENGLRKGR